jgi:Fe-S-cluster containining protein
MRTHRISLNVVSPPRPAPEPIPSVRLSEPMRRFRCNQKGCCCSGWDIPFQLEDFLRLREHLPEDERANLGRGIQLVLDAKKGTDGERVLQSLKLEGVGEDRACRFLEPSGACGVHVRHGIDALPDLCVDFPAFPLRREDSGVELWFDPVCPEVLERLDEANEPLRLDVQQGAFGDPGLDLRASHASDPTGARIGGERVPLPVLDRIRERCLEAFADRARPPWRTLAAVSQAFRDLRPAHEDSFEVVEPADPEAFLSFLRNAVAANGADVLASTFVRYRRFVHAIDPAPIANSKDVLVAHLHEWEPAMATWLAPVEEPLRPLMTRWMAHRFGAPMTLGRGDLQEAADQVVHIYGTSLRFAAAIGATLARQVDRAIYKVALGAAEYFYRSFRLPRDVLPWFAAANVSPQR